MRSPSKQDCIDWKKNKLINPLTKRKIQKGKSVYNNLKKNCEEILTQPNPFFIQVVTSFLSRGSIVFEVYLKVKESNKEILNILKDLPPFKKTTLKDIAAAKCVFKIENQNLYLSYFYNYIHQYDSYFTEELKAQTKGVGLVLLNFGLKVALKEKWIILSSEFTLFASGTIIGKDMRDLIDYYKSLGFELESHLDECLKSYICNMKSTVETVLEKIAIKIKPSKWINQIMSFTEY